MRNTSYSVTRHKAILLTEIPICSKSMKLLGSTFKLLQKNDESLPFQNYNYNPSLGSHPNGRPEKILALNMT